MSKQTVLNPAHRALGARMVDFGGWDMPLVYTSQLDEHHAVRRAAGMFDVSHMCVVDLHGADCRGLLRLILANDIDKLKRRGKALYSCMLDQRGGVIDDLIVYFLADDHFRAVVNAGTRDKDLAWIESHARDFGVRVEARDDLAIIACQGPQARTHVAQAIGAPAALDLARFEAASFGAYFLARTGYTGEDGFEVVLPNSDAVALWEALRQRGVVPAGLGARDTLRLEAGLNLYGQDMDETTTPFESGLAWTVAMEPAARDFIGRAALQAQRASGVPRQMIALVLEDKGVLRHAQVVHTAHGSGEICSGGFAPTLERSIALARVPSGALDAVEVDIRGRMAAARVVNLPFVRDGRARI